MLVKTCEYVWDNNAFWTLLISNWGTSGATGIGTNGAGGVSNTKLTTLFTIVIDIGL